MFLPFAFRRTTSNVAPGGTLVTDTDGRFAQAWVTGITGTPTPTLALTQWDADTVDVLDDVQGAGTVDNPWAWEPVSGLGAVDVDVAVELSNGVGSDWTDTDTINIPASVWASGITYTASVTATDKEDLDGSLLRTVTSPAHLAAYDAGQAEPGIYRVTPADIANGPLVLYPGLLANSQTYPGGTISVTNAPWAVGDGGTITTAYRVMLGETELATSLPYSTSGENPGDRLEIFADLTDSNGTTTVKVGEFTLEENPLGPVLSDFAIDYDTNSFSCTSNLGATVRVRRYPSNHVFVNQAQEVWDGTGITGTETNEFAAAAGPNPFSCVWTGGLSGAQEVYAVARVGAGPLSNVIGGAVNITPAGASLTAPLFRASTIDGTTATVSTLAIPLPAYEAGDLVQLPIAYDCRADFIVGVTATGPNGEVATVAQAAVDNEEGGNSAASICLLYYRATAPNTSGSVTINLTPGGFKNAEQIACTPIIRHSVKASGNPYGQILRTFSSTATANATTAALTAVSAASRIEAVIVNDATLPPGTAPSGWFMREVGLQGFQGIQAMSRNAETTAGESVAAATVPLGSTSQRWVALTWELLPLGA